MNSEPEGDAWARFVAGESDAEESATITAWLSSNRADAAFVESVKAHADRAEGSAAVPVDVEAALAAVRAKLELTSPREGFQMIRGGGATAAAARPNAVVARTPRWRTLPAAAAFAAAAALMAWVGVRSLSQPTVADGDARVVATSVGQRDSLVLSDGSRVVLAPGSRLNVAAGFAEGDRTVTLEGAAHFDVVHDDARPFTVLAAGTTIRDVGTAFTVKTDATGGVSVAVTHGIVTVATARDLSAETVELRAGDRGVVSNGVVAVSRGSVGADESLWTRGQLTYRDASLSEVQADLRRWYGVQLLPDSSLAGLTVTMSPQSDSANVVNAIVAMLGAEMVQRGDSIILRAAGSGTNRP